MATFSHPGQTTSHGGVLHPAVWPHGGQVWFDRRGLVHLAGKDPAAPQVSLVLGANAVAGWTSDGYCCGPEFFFKEPFASDPVAVFERMLRCLAS